MSQDGSCLYHSLLYFYANPQVPAILYCYYLTSKMDIPHYDILSTTKYLSNPPIEMPNVDQWRKNYQLRGFKLETTTHENSRISRKYFRNEHKQQVWVKKQKKRTTFGDDTTIFVFVCMTGINLTVYKFNNNDIHNPYNAENGCYQYFMKPDKIITQEEKRIEEQAAQFGLSIEQYQKSRLEAEQLQMPFEEYLQMIM